MSHFFHIFSQPNIYFWRGPLHTGWGWESRADKSKIPIWSRWFSVVSGPNYAEYYEDIEPSPALSQFVVDIR